MHVDRKLRLLPIPRKLGLQVLCGRRCRRCCEVAGTLPCLLLPRAGPGGEGHLFIFYAFPGASCSDLK